MTAPAGPHRLRPAGLVALRGLGVLLVLLGVLAMHAVAGGNHMAGMSGPPPPAASGESVTAGEPTGAGAMPAMSAPAGEGMGAACVAVLSGPLLLTARTAAATARTAPAPVPSGAGHRSAPLGRGPPRQLLARLCVLRT